MLVAKIRFLAVFILIALTLTSCVPDNSQDLVVNVDLAYPQVIKNFDLQDLQQVDSLLSMTSDDKSNNRFAVANAFGSFASKKSLDSLATLLYDPVEEIRVAAAYALGQSGYPEAAPLLAKAFVSDPNEETNTRFNETVLEAIGKVGDSKIQSFITSVKNYRPDDVHLLKGQALALYRFALRQIVSPEGTELMTERALDQTFPKDISLVAANYLARAKTIKLDSVKYRILTALDKEDNPAIRMALATAIGKVNDPQIATSLKNLLANEKDYRVRTNLIRSFAKMPYDSVATTMINHLDDTNTHVALTAADYFKSHGLPQLAKEYILIADSIRVPEVQAKMYEATSYHLPNYLKNTRARLNQKILAKANDGKNVYDKLAYLKALATHPLNYQQIKISILDSKSEVLRSQLLQALGDMIASPKFAETYRTGASQRYFKRDFVKFLKELMLEQDSGIVAVGGTILSNPNNGFETIKGDFLWLDTLRTQLDLPKEIEAYQEVDKAIAQLIEGRKLSKVVTSKKNPINWGLLEGASDTSRAQIITDKGDITLELFTTKTPGSVANFITLANKNFYDNKLFHRVVPNFVAQGGCPRGDGYGSMDYTIRSETPQLYYDQEGMVGMASAGKHTESSQFFITHSPAMHLDGNYTVFGRVISGMEVVHELQPGDMIKDVRIIK